MLRRRGLSSTAAAAAFDPLDPAHQGWTPDQLSYRAVAADFAASELAPHAGAWDEDGVFPEAALRAAAAIGFGGMYCDPSYGGSGMSRSDALAVVEALAGADPSTAAYITIHNMVALSIQLYARSEDLKREWIPRLCSMEVFGSYCLTEPGAGSDAASLTTRAVRTPSGYTLHGQKAFISGGGRSDVYLIMARTGAADSGHKGITCFLVPARSPGLSFGAQERKMGWRSQPTSAVFLDSVHVPESARLGEEGDGFKIAMRGLNGGRLNIAACSLGAGSAALLLARDHVRTRTQFGAPLASNQAVAFKLADMATALHSARLTMQFAANSLDTGHPGAATHCAMAKRVATDAGWDVVDAALQLHGGYGYLKDLPLERWLRDLRVHRILEGTNEIMNVLIAKAVLAA